MRIKVTYEKKDILRLVHKDIQAQGIRVKSGTTLAYKGALQITVQVDTEDETPSPAPPSASSVDSSTEPTSLPTAAEEAVQMGSVLGASQQLVMTEPGRFETREPRSLEVSERMQESSDFPED